MLMEPPLQELLLLLEVRMHRTSILHLQFKRFLLYIAAVAVMGKDNAGRVSERTL